MKEPNFKKYYLTHFGFKHAKLGSTTQTLTCDTLNFDKKWWIKIILIYKYQITTMHNEGLINGTLQE